MPLSENVEFSTSPNLVPKRQNLAYQIMLVAESLRDDIAKASKLLAELTNSGLTFTDSDFSTALQTKDGYVSATHLNADLIDECIAALTSICDYIDTNSLDEPLDGVRR